MAGLESMTAALQRIAQNEVEVWDEDEGANVLVAMTGEDAAEIATAALAALTPMSSGDCGDGWRPEVRAFADLMEAKLRANDHKPGWKGEHPFDLLTRLREETAEVGRELVNGVRPDADWPARLGAEAADVANFAMMIADVCGALPSSPAPKEDDHGQ